MGKPLHLNRWKFAWLPWVSGIMPLNIIFCCSLEECGAASKGLFEIIIYVIGKHDCSRLLRMLYFNTVFTYCST